MEQKYLNTKLISVLASFLAIGLIMPKEALGQYYSQGETKRSISIDKKIRPINSNKSFDNIDKDEKTFIEGDSLDFSILVENTGNQELLNLNVNDYLPAYQNVIFNPGIYDKNTAKVNWVIDRLGIGESKVFTIRTKIGLINSSNSQMITNKACISGDNLSDCDSASFFVTGKSVPSTGSGGILIQSLLGVFGVGIALAVRKFIRGY